MLFFVDTDLRSVRGSLRELCTLFNFPPVSLVTFELTLTPSALSSPSAMLRMSISLVSPLAPEETGRRGKSERDKQRLQGAREPVSYSRFSPYPGAFVVV